MTGDRRLPHGYTNDTSTDGRVVVKVYRGPDVAGRRGREAAALRATHGRLPVPLLLGVDERESRFSFLPGVHGQELIAAGHGRAVLSALGTILRDIHRVDPGAVVGEGPAAPGSVLVHGDFGPNNVLLSPDGSAVTAVLDWEWARAGDPIVDLAWCEWIVRMHHRELVGDLGLFFAAYGSRPSWPRRQAAMVAQCRAFAELWGDWQPAAETTANLRRRLAVTESWTE